MHAERLLAEIPSPAWSEFHIGPVPIHAYALCILAGIVVCVWLTMRRWKARGGTEDHIWDIAIWAIPFGIVGGRLYHVFSTPAPYFGPNGDPWMILQIYKGGLGIWGAIVLGALGAWIGARRAGLRMPMLVDAAAPGVLLAQGIGRWGNWFNQELFGRPTDLPWGLHIDYILNGSLNPNWPGPEYSPGTLFHPTFLYESIWDIGLAFLLMWLGRKMAFNWGQTFWAYVCLYTVGRVWIEFLRIDTAVHILGLRINVFTCIVVFIIGGVFFYLSWRRHGFGSSAGIYLPGHSPDDAETSDPGKPTSGRRRAGVPRTGAMPVVEEGPGSATTSDPDDRGGPNTAPGSTDTGGENDAGDRDDSGDESMPGRG